MLSYWSSYFYLYGVGGALFFTAIYLGVKKNVLNLKKLEDKKLLAGFLFAYFFYAGVHAVWNVYAIEGIK